MGKASPYIGYSRITPRHSMSRGGRPFAHPLRSTTLRITHVRSNSQSSDLRSLRSHLSASPRYRLSMQASEFHSSALLSERSVGVVTPRVAQWSSSHIEET